MTTHSAFQPAELSGADPGVRTVVEHSDADLYCFGCGYNLRGLPGGRCPECGRTIDRHEQAGLDVPWVHRGRLGAPAAFWQTAALATFRPGDFARRFHWPRVRFHGSHAFRLWTIGCAAGAVVLAAAAIAWRLGVTPGGIFVLAAAAAPSACVLAYGATELSGFFTGPRMPSDTSEEVFRARMVNDYASAALSWTPVPAFVLTVGVAAGKLVASPVDEMLFLLAAALAAWIGILWVGGVLVLFGRALALGTGILVLAALFFPVRFAGLVVLTTLFVFAPLLCAVGGLVSLAR